MKYCKDCKYCERELWCNFPNKIDYVTGKPSVKFCHLVRNDATLCGAEAKWFEKKETEVKINKLDLLSLVSSWFK